MCNAMTAIQSDGIDDTSIGDIIKGQEVPTTLINDLDADCALPDALFKCIQLLVATPSRLRGFCRAVQKRIEQVSS